MTKTIKETWKEEIYEIITHNETSECHSKLVALVESLISQVEALVRRETIEDILNNVIKTVWEEDETAETIKQIKEYAKTKDIW